MGVAYSGGPVVYATARCDTSANFRGDLDAALTRAGWTTKAAITGGFKYTISSPQGLSCKVKIFDDGSTIFGGFHYLTVQFLSADETLPGFAHKLLYGIAAYQAAGYELVANPCQLFVSLKGIADQALVAGNRDYSVAGGIPFVEAATVGECAASAGGAPAVTQMFWSSGMSAAGNWDFRNSRWCSNCYSWCRNGSLFAAAADNNAYSGPLCLYALTPTYDVDAFWFSGPRVQKYKTGAPLYIDAFLGWGYQIQGQLWDALLATRDQPLDSTMTSTQTDAAGNTRSAEWIAWNHDATDGEKGGTGTYYGTLYLLKSASGSAGPGYFTSGRWNYAY